MHIKYSHASYLRALFVFISMLLVSYANATLPIEGKSDENLPVLMVDIQHHAVTMTATSVPAFTPYHGAIDRSPYLGWIILMCAWLLPTGMLVVTVTTVFDFRKRRQDDELFVAALAAS
ncbi:MAG: hypothetical protein HY254_14010 [Burkholderiales bacterium]|nr:hypothetical protein [Burkholderiales bacterium]